MNIYFQVHLEFLNLSYQTSESFLLKLRPGTYLHYALLHSSKASSKARMLKPNIHGSHKTPSKSAVSSSPPLTTSLRNSAFHHRYLNLYSRFHPYLPQLQPHCHICCSLFQYPPDQSLYPPLLSPCHTNKGFQIKGTKTALRCLNCPEKFCQNTLRS